MKPLSCRSRFDPSEFLQFEFKSNSKPYVEHVPQVFADRDPSRFLGIPPGISWALESGIFHKNSYDMNAWVCFKHSLRVSRAQGQGSSNTLREEFMHDWIRFSKVAEALSFPNGEINRPCVSASFAAICM